MLNGIKTRPWSHKKYHPNFKERAKRVREENNYTCECCQHNESETYISRNGNITHYRTCGAHAIPFTELDEKAPLLCLCVRCHFLYDMEYKNVKKLIKTGKMSNKELGDFKAKYAVKYYA